MILKIYSILRFLITTFILVALAWQGFIQLQDFQTRTVKNLTPLDELIRALKDEQVYLEKYRLFKQKVLLDEVKRNCTLAETKLEEFSHALLAQTNLSKAGKTLTKIRPILVVTDSIRGSIKTRKVMIDNLSEMHREEDLTKTAIFSIGELRTELEKAVNHTIALRRLTLTSFEELRDTIWHRIKLHWLCALVLISILYIFELILIFKAFKRKKPAGIPRPAEVINSTPEKAGVIQKPPADEESIATLKTQSIAAPAKPKSVSEQIPLRPIDFLLLQANLQKIAETIDDLSERISLMAFNAELWATRSGDETKSFQVMAEELRRLAERSTKQKSMIEKLVEEISNKLSDVKSA